ncbi:peptidylprolyl isomerase [Myxococcota bacterium]|nr:peptidylprolyl isomerase [Myxococcota bacterium]
MFRFATLLTSLFFILLFGACTSSQVAQNPQVVLTTNLGDITIELFQDKAPISTKNFLRYVDEGFYEGVIFHRVIPGFMLQGGGFKADLNKKTPHEMIKNEATNGLKNLRGTLSMARTGVVDSATSQFFLNLVDNKALDQRDTSRSGYGYAVFGKVISGMDVADKIAAVECLCPSRSRTPCTAQLPPGMKDVPAKAVVIQKAVRINK